MNITINSSKFTVTTEELSYEEICDMISKPHNLTVTYYAKVSGDIFRNGTVTPGKKLKLCEGMVISGVFTGNA